MLADIDIDRPAPGRQGQSMMGDRYLGTCWPGQWAPINQSLLPLLSLVLTKQALILMVPGPFLPKTKSTPTAGPCQSDQEPLATRAC